MSRLKLFISILIIAIMSIVFIQNRELIALKLLCADDNSCVYQTPQLPLAIWIGLFILIGALLNLLSQAFNRYSYSSSNRPKPTLDDELYSGSRNWKSSSAKTKDSINLDKFPDTTSYEVRQEPQNVEHSGSTYSYKYREASDRSKERFDNNRDRSIEPNLNSEADRDDEDWI